MVNIRACIDGHIGARKQRDSDIIICGGGYGGGRKVCRGKGGSWT